MNQHQKSLILCNHVSYLDIILVGSLVRGKFLSKKEVAAWPLIGWCGTWAEMIFVNRLDIHDRVTALFKLKQACLSGRAIVFPEGTTTSNMAPAWPQWQRGNIWAAHRSVVPLIAVGIHYRNQHQIAWTDEQSFLPHLLKVFSLPKISVKIRAKIVKPDCNCLGSQAQEIYSQVVQLCHEAAGKIPGGIHPDAALQLHRH